MKIFLPILLLVSSIYAKDKATIGLGAYAFSQPYQNTSVVVTPTPVIFFDNSLFYIRWAKLGLYFLGDKSEDLSWAFSLAAQPNPLGYKSSDSTILKDMSEKKPSWEGGVEFAVKNSYGWLSLTYYLDILNISNANSFIAQIGTTYHVGKIRFDPIAILRYDDTNFNNYYYGINHAEATNSRAYYVSKDSLNFAFESFITYSILKKYSIISNIKVEFLDSSIKDSPIVNDSYRYSGMLSLVYTFFFD